MGIDSQCTFCRIVAGQSPASFVHRDDEIVAFMDINPVTPGHLLVVPTDHLPTLADVPEDLSARMWTLGRRLAAALRASPLRTEGINLFYADGDAAFQEVFHAHLHVIPRFAGDQFRIHANWGANPSRESLDETAAEIRSAAQRAMP